MKIVVAAKHAADLDDDFELRDDGLDVDPDYLEWGLNEWDSFALEEALRIREAEGGEVVVVTAAGEEADESIRDCLAKGADRAVRAWDDDLAEIDALGAARILAATIEGEGPDLILFGVQSSDGASGATGSAVAGYLGLPHVAVVRRLEYDAASRTATVERELEGGTVELVRVRCPALLTVQTGINEPRYATLRAIKQAAEKPLAVVGLEELGLDVEVVEGAVGSRRERLAPPERGDDAETLGESTGEIATRIAKIVEGELAA